MYINCGVPQSVCQFISYYLLNQSSLIMRLTIFFALSLAVGVVTSLPMSSTSQPNRELQEKLYQQWPGVEDERLADAEVDNAYELYKHKTRKPKILQVSPNDILSEPPAKLNL
ncbi:uncharacterized protein Dvir_GJ26279 [Drosophila virilis]|uniref:Uncharacterized protein n=1 Tax=Drosophila virilis TaxID=7244 RepID=A0A0Q9WUF6_DROVI|nr:uncharacterized protein LOC26531049 [Drosophila virilis]KRF84494.1 uncharacterized protein Dvir_GJ26279 [Drosophila virilis]